MEDRGLIDSVQTLVFQWQHTSLITDKAKNIVVY